MANQNHICEADSAMLKQKALSYLPRNLGEPDAHRQILTAIAQVVPDVSFCIEKADVMIWPKVASGELPVNRAIAQCAYEADTSIGSANPDAYLLQALPEETLLQAWIALDYYGYVLKADYSLHIRNLQNQISGILLADKSEDLPFKPQEEPVSPIEPTQPITDEGPKIPTADTPPDPTPWTNPPKNEKPKKKKSGKGGVIVAILVALALVIGFASSFIFNDVRKTESAIDKIGTVSLESEGLILEAEQLYNELDESQQERVENSDTLFAARSAYDALVTDDAIDKIGTVTMASLDAIEDAEKLYDALSRDARNLVKNYKVLTAARKEYARLETAIQDASDAIDAIGEVTLESGSVIEAARSAYNALKKDNLESHLASKLSILTNAEKEYQRLVGQDLYETGMAYAQKNKNQEAIDCFDTIIADFTDAELVQNARDAKANCQVALAKQSYDKKDYYTATKTLENVDAQYRNHENYLKLQDQIASALKKNRPNNGANIADKAGWGRCYFKIKAGDQDVCFKFQNTSDSSKYRMVYIRAGQTAKINIKDGTYSVKFATGDDWYSTDYLFGDDTVYKSKGTVEFTTTTKGNTIYYWYVDLDLSDPTFTASTISASNF